MALRLISDALRALIWFGFAVVTLGVLAAGILYLRLSEGPVHLPYAANLAVRLFNEDSDRFKVAIGDMVITLGDANIPPGIQFIDLNISDNDGQVLFSVPQLAARFDTTSLLRGEVRPTEIVLARPEARLLRTTDGLFRFGLGDPVAVAEGERSGPAALGEPIVEASAAETAHLEAMARILDGLTGDAPLTPELSLLREVQVVRANFTYENEEIDRVWQTRRADLKFERTERGLEVRLEVNLADGAVAGAGAVLIVRRVRGDTTTEVEAEFQELRPEHLAEQLDQMQWLALFDAPLDGHLYASIDREGGLEALSGRIEAGKGQIRSGETAGQKLDSVVLDFAYAPGLQRMRIGSLTLTSPSVYAQLTGFADLRRGGEGEVSGLAGQFEVIRIDARVPEIFAAPLGFDGGQIVARLDLEPTRLQVGSAYLSEGNLVLDVAGAAWVEGGEWRTDLRAEGRNLTVPELLQHWPVIAAPSPRAWVAEHILDGAIDHVVAQMRLGGEQPRLNLDFRFSNLESTYLGDMSPIRKATGWGNLTPGEFILAMESGEVEPVTGSPVDMTGSTFHVLDIRNRPWPAVATIRARGETSSVLALVNEPPLGFMDKLGMQPDVVQGTAEVEAVLRLPLIGGLALEDVDVEARSTLSDLRLPFSLGDGRVLDVAGESVTLEADKEAMRFTGPVTVNGKPIGIEWNEYFAGATTDRTIDLTGSATTALLADFGLDSAYFTGGEAPMKLRLAQAGGPGFSFDLEADLAPAHIAIPELNWSKPPGEAGRLKAAGTFGAGTKISSFSVESSDLAADGSAEFADDGLISAEVARLRFRGQADVSLAARRTEGGGFDLTVGGNSLNLALFDDPPDAVGGGVPLNVAYNLSELIITPKVIARPASGTFRRDASGKKKADVDGRIGDVPFTATYRKDIGEPGVVDVSSQDAGGVLRAAGLFQGATGGSLRLKGQIAPVPGTDLAGVATIKDVRISNADTFQSILDEGGADVAADAAEKGGLEFSKVKVPFELQGDKLLIDDSTAEGSLIAVKVEGTLDEASNQIDLVGAISPLYQLSKPIDKIPILGHILSGGEGEGIFAMTFSVAGTLEQPTFSVSPLSLLAPGFLRTIFSSRGEQPDERFLEMINREVD